MQMVMAALLASLLIFGARPAFSQSQKSTLSPRDAYELGVQAYLYGYPLVLMELTRQAFTQRLPMNQFQHAQTFPPAAFHRVVRPNVDTLYSTAWLDVSRQPIVMSVPDTQGRFYVVQMLDAWTETFAVPGARTTGTRAGQFAIVGPEWSGTVPSQMTTIRAPTNHVWLIGRIQTNGSDDYPFVRALQRGLRLAPLDTAKDGSSSLPLASSAKPTKDDVPPPAQVAQMDAVQFFAVLAEAMKYNPPHADDAPFISQFRAIGLVPGKSFDAFRLDAETRRSLERAAGEARLRLSRVDALVRNGWTFRNVIGRYGTGYLSRAAVARAGLGALPTEDAITLSTATDSDGRPLSGANAYALHLTSAGIPPVNAFWSLTLYDANGYFVPNVLNRYAVRDRDNLRFNEDGSLNLYVQKNPPSDARIQNWLPAPDGAFNLSLRLYWPTEKAIDGQWTPPKVQRSP